MKLPPKKRRGDIVAAADWNALIDAIAARTPMRCTGAELVMQSGGFFYRFKRQALPDPTFHPFQAVVTGSDALTFKTGDVWGWEGSDDAVSSHVTVAEYELSGLSGSFASGSVWLQVNLSGQDDPIYSDTDEHDHTGATDADGDHDHGGEVTTSGTHAHNITAYELSLENQRLYPVSVASPAYSPAEPTVGGAPWAANPKVYVKICDYDFAENPVVTHQYIRDHIQLGDNYALLP